MAGVYARRGLVLMVYTENGHGENGVKTMSIKVTEYRPDDFCEDNSRVVDAVRRAMYAVPYVGVTVSTSGRLGGAVMVYSTNSKNMMFVYPGERSLTAALTRQKCVCDVHEIVETHTVTYDDSARLAELFEQMCDAGTGTSDACVRDAVEKIDSFPTMTVSYVDGDCVFVEDATGVFAMVSPMTVDGRVCWRGTVYPTVRAYVDSRFGAVCDDYTYVSAKTVEELVLRVQGCSVETDGE